jgi:predicted ATPase
VNYRPEYSHSWGSKTYYTQLRLDPLGKESAGEMLSALLGDGEGLAPLKRVIIEKTEGNPFFMEETVQVLLDEGALVRDGSAVRLTRPLSELKIPPTVQGIIASRIDRLPPAEKELLQTLAVVGMDFPTSLVRQVVTRPEAEVQPLLSNLQLGEFIYEQPAFPDIEYTFRHALTHDVAYNSVLIERRKLLHERVGAAIEALFTDKIHEHLGDLAHHYARSANRQKAVEYLRLAGEQSLQRYANAEAISRFTSALELLKTLPDSPQRAHDELVLLTILGPVLVATMGNGAPEVGAVYARAVELGRQLGEDAQLFPVLFGLRSFYLVRGDVQTAQELGEQLLSLAQSLQDSALLLEAQLALGNTLFLRGEPARAREHLEQGISLYEPHHHRPHIVSYGADPGVLCLFFAARVLWMLGYPDQARKRSHEALSLAQELAHPYSLAAALIYAATLYQFLREGQAAQERAEAAIALSTEQGFSALVAYGTIFQGCTQAGQGQREEGVAQMHQGLAALRATGAEVWLPFSLALLAEAYGEMGQAEEGLTMLAEALMMAEKTRERFWEAELYRLKGELTLQKFQVPGSKVSSSSSKFEVRGPESDAEECFLKAIEIAHKQQAKSLELRAVMSLSRLWQQQGKKAEAQRMLSEIYSWFTEGFDTADLKDAKALLEELS